MIATPGRARSSLILAFLASAFLSPSAGIAGPALPSPAPAPLTLSEILDKMAQKNAERAKDLEHFQGRRIYQLDYKGFPTDMHAELIVNIRYDAPATESYTVISQSGPSWMINRVLKRLIETEQESLLAANRARVQVTSDNYNFTLLDSKDSGDGCSYVLAVQPKVVTKFLFRGKIWVDNKDFAVCRIEAEPARNPSFWITSTQIHHSFVKVGEFWLPAENTSVSNTRLDGRATLTIQYDNYAVQSAPAFQAAASPALSPN